MVWAIIGWFFLGLLALLVLLLLLPVTLHVCYTEGKLVLAVRVLFVKLRVLQLPTPEPSAAQKQKKDIKKKKRQQRTEAKKHKKHKKQKQQEKTQGEEPEEAKQKRTPAELLRLVKRIAAGAGGALRILFKFMHFKDVALVIPVHAEEDAAKTAKQYGQMQMLVGTVRAALANVVRISYIKLLVIADFAGQHQDALSFSCKIVASPVIILLAGAVGLKRFLFYNRAARKARRRANRAR